MSRKLYNLKNARTEEQFKKMQSLEREGQCNFCQDYSGEYKLKTPVVRTNFCRASENMTPYENSRYHFLIIFNRCIEKRSELTKEEWLDLNEVCTILEEVFKMPGSSLLVRSGNWDYTGSSVSHLHAHLIMGSGDANKKVKARVG
jgi:diadenosine tetraphosphate (Ap4A) HIT family hydrolase